MQCRFNLKYLLENYYFVLFYQKLKQFEFSNIPLSQLIKKGIIHTIHTSCFLQTIQRNHKLFVWISFDAKIVYRTIVSCGGPMGPQGAYEASGPIPQVSPRVPGTMPLYCITSLCNAVVMG